MLASRIVPQVSKQIAKRNFSYYSGSTISGPPTVKVPFAERIVLGGIMIGSFLIFPSWVLTHMEEYKGHS